MKRRKRRKKRKISKQGRLRMSINSLLDTMEEENTNLRYIADALLRHFLDDDKAFEDFMQKIGGNRAKAMLRAFKTLYRRSTPFSKRIVERLSSVRFTQKIERQQRLTRAQTKKPPPLQMGSKQKKRTVKRTTKSVSTERRTA